MNTMIVALLLAAPAQQETLKQEVLITVDAKGDAVMKLDFILTASQWLNWKQQYGDHPDLLKRNMTVQFPRYLMTEFRLERDDVNRKATAHLRLKGGSRYRGGGRYEMSIEKGMTRVTDTGREWHFTTSQLISDKVIMMQNIKVVLPEGTTDARLSAPSDAQEQTLSYRVPAGGATSVWPFLFGASLVGMVVPFVLPRKRAA